MVRVAVIGAGIVGLSTAHAILDNIPGVQVTILAEKFTPDTTSNVAAGLYRPGVAFSGPTREITTKWLKDSLAYIKNMMNKSPDEARKAGIVDRSGFIFSTEREHLVKNAFLEKLLDVHRPCTQEELHLFSKEDYKYGTYLKTYLIDSNYYLPYLTKKIQTQGGRFYEKVIKDFEEIAHDYDIICNCTGLGSRDLCSDSSMSPIRGQVFKVKAPWIKNFVYVDYETYIIPGIDYVTLGGTRQFDSWKAEVDRLDSEGIWERCTKAIPSLKDAEIVKECVGWRPYRPVVRVEKEVKISSSGKVMKIVHNYGHGGYGVMSAPGTALHAASLVQEYIATSSKL